MSESENDEDFDGCIVIDNGTFMVKAGFAGDDSPCAVFPNCVSRSHCNALKNNPGFQQMYGYVGDEVYSKKGVLQRFYPMKAGRIEANRWGDIEQVWRHTFENELRIYLDGGTHSVMHLFQKPTSKCTKEKIVKMMFETFNCRGTYIGTPAVMSLVASGRQNGIIVESRHESTRCVPIYDLYELRNASTRNGIGGKHATQYVNELIDDKLYSLECVRDIKEKLCYFATESDMKVQEVESKEYELPDGQIVTIGSERFRATEIIFNPLLIGRKEQSVDELLFESIIKLHGYELDMHQMKTNIVLAGGNTMYTSDKCKSLEFIYF